MAWFVGAPPVSGRFREGAWFATFIALPCACRVDGPKTQDRLEFSAHQRPGVTGHTPRRSSRSLDALAAPGPFGFVLSRDLLGDAVDVAAAEEDLAGRDADDLAVGESLGEDLARFLVALRVQKRIDDP